MSYIVTEISETRSGGRVIGRCRQLTEGLGRSLMHAVDRPATAAEVPS
jgi:hypothetical protein